MMWILSILFCLSASAQIPQRLMLDELRAVPRGSAWSPTSIAGLVRWYDAQSIVGLNNGDAISVWEDKAGTTNLMQSGASRQPVYVASNAAYGNKPCVKFDTTSDVLTNVSPGDESMTLFIVAYRTNTTDGVLCQIHSSDCQIYNDYSGAWEYRWFSSGGASRTNSAESAQSPGVMIAKWTSLSSLSIRSQSGAWVTGNPTDAYATADSTFSIGATYGGFNRSGAFVGEVLLYNSPLSDADVNLVGKYLAARWNFTWTDL